MNTAPPPPLRFFARRREALPFFFAYLISHQFRTFLKILSPGHLRSGHQVRSSDPASGKSTLYQCYRRCFTFVTGVVLNNHWRLIMDNLPLHMSKSPGFKSNMIHMVFLHTGTSMVEFNTPSSISVGGSTVPLTTFLSSE